MEQQLKLFRVFIASPGDLGDERRALREVVEKINGIFSKETEWRIELLGWEDTSPGAGRPQELINADLEKADLFIGCLWQRWGSSSGSDGKTGFEEEFDRSVERRAKSGSPEIWLFFKDVDAVTRSDPGPQLQKVLAFRTRETEAKRLLFKEFCDVAAWREMLSDLLQRHMLRLVTARLASAGGVQSTGTPQSKVETSEAAAESPQSQGKRASAFASLAGILKQAEEKVRLAKLAVLDRSEALAPPEAIRLLLFAASNYDWNAQHVQLGSHEMNSVYYHRTALDTTTLERIFLLRTILLDGSLTKPGWFWINKWNVPPSTWLAWFASFDSEEAMRETALDLATRIGFPLYKRKKNAESPIARLLVDQAASVRLAALKHLAVVGRPADLPAAERLLQDENKEVRTQAERTARLVRLRADPDAETKKSIEQRDAFDDEISAAVARNADRIADVTLVLALGHPSGALKAVASKELLKRGRILPELALVMCADEAKAVKECGFLAQVAQGRLLDVSKVRAALSEPYSYGLSGVPWWNKADPERVISACFDRLSADELWTRVCAFSEDSHLALRAVGRNFFAQSAPRIRADLSDDFQKQAEARKKKGSETTALLDFSSLLASYGDPTASIESARKRVRASALETLADHPHQVDRELFLRFLSADFGDWAQNVACLRGLASVGQANDREKFASLLSSEMPYVEAAAARAYLALSPSSVVGAKDLLNEPSEYRVWVVIRHALKSGKRSSWPLVKPLLGHETENIRRLACYYAVRALKKAAVVKLLNEYLARGFYFYNVVTLLDRALYAPRILRDAYTREEDDFFEKWRPVATWQWEEH
jgi:hypothetical protein